MPQKMTAMAVCRADRKSYMLQCGHEKFIRNPSAGRTPKTSVSLVHDPVTFLWDKRQLLERPDTVGIDGISGWRI